VKKTIIKWGKTAAVGNFSIQPDVDPLLSHHLRFYDSPVSDISIATGWIRSP